MNLKRPLTFEKMCDFLLANEREAKDLYHTKKFTSKQVADHFQIVHNNNFAKACFSILGSKNLGLGGARKGAGNFAESKRKPKKDKKVFAFSFNKEIEEILSQIGKETTHTKFVQEAIFWYHREINKK